MEMVYIVLKMVIVIKEILLIINFSGFGDIFADGRNYIGEWKNNLKR